MKRSILATALALLAFSAHSTAWAGATSGENVVLTANSARGSLQDVRFSADATQFITCALAASAGSPSVTCYARNSAGTQVSCYSYDATMVQAAHAIHPHTHLEFRWGANGLCTAIYTYNSSLYVD